MKLNFDYKGTKITYELTYKRTNAISIKVSEGKVIVVAPRGTSVYAVMDKVKGNAPWIIRELYGSVPVKGEVKLLEQYTYLGKNYKLEIVTDSQSSEIKVKMARGKFIVETYTDSPVLIREAIIEWYTQKLQAKIKERLKAYQDTFTKKPEAINIVDHSSILFQLNEKEIIANVRVGLMPAEVIDYILVRSLSRINSSKQEEEEAKVSEVLPTAEKSRLWLEENMNKLML